MTTAVRDISQDRFAIDVVEASRSKPVVVDFWAPWCAPCRQLSPLLERVAARHADGVEVVKVNVDEAPEVARSYGVSGIPAVKAFKDGNVVAEFVGLQPEAVLERLFASVTPTVADRLVAGALSAADDERERLLREALAAEPGHVRAIVALAELLAARGEADGALALLARVPTDAAARGLAARLRLTSGGSEDIAALRSAAAGGAPAARLRLGAALAAAGDHAAALPELVAAVADPAVRGEAREAVLQVFAALGDADPLVRTWRPKLAAALF